MIGPPIHDERVRGVEPHCGKQGDYCARGARQVKGGATGCGRARAKDNKDSKDYKGNKDQGPATRNTKKAKDTGFLPLSLRVLSLLSFVLMVPGSLSSLILVVGDALAAPCSQDSAHGERIDRVSRRSASGSFTKRSLFGFHWSLRPRSMAMPPRWQTVAAR
jgi:hypothetical protein